MASGWSRDPTEDQQRFYKLLRDVYVYEPNTINGLLILRRKVGYAMYGIPDEESKSDNAHTGYSKEKYKTIKAVVDFIIEINNKKERDGDQIYMAIIFVCVDHQGVVLPFPVFRILVRERTWIFIDTNCRYYLSWDDFLQFNELPEGRFCWPRNGIYSGDADDEVELRWGVTPAAKANRKALEKMDTASSCIGLAAVTVPVIGSIGCLTPIAPVLAAVGISGAVFSGAYTVIRNSTTLADRSIHGQTVNPFRDPEAAKTWLSMATGVVDLTGGVGKMTAAMVSRKCHKAGRIVGIAVRTASMTAGVTWCCIEELSSGQRVKEGEATRLEVYQFAASLLFFAHATVNLRTASQIMKEIQERGIDLEDSLRRYMHRKQQFMKSAKNTAATGENVLDGNSRVIRGIHWIDDKYDFFAGMVETREVFSGHEAGTTVYENIVVNGGTETRPVMLDKKQRRELLYSVQQASQGTIRDATLRARFDSVLSVNTAGSSGRSDLADAVNTLTKQLQQGMQGTTIGRNEVALMMSVVDELTVLVCPQTDNECAKCWHLIWHHVSQLVREIYDAYDEALNLELEHNDIVDIDRFNIENGIQITNVFMHFTFMIYKQCEDNIQELKNNIAKRGI